MKVRFFNEPYLLYENNQYFNQPYLLYENNQYPKHISRNILKVRRVGLSIWYGKSIVIYTRLHNYKDKHIVDSSFL